MIGSAVCDRGFDWRHETAPSPRWLQAHSQSQAGQDLFVAAITNGKRQGTWLELGAGHPFGYNNTWLLESQLGWSGFSVDLQDKSRDEPTLYQHHYALWRQSHGERGHVVAWADLDETAKLLHAEEHDRLLSRYITPADAIPPHARSWSNLRPSTAFTQCDALSFGFQSLPPHVDYLQVDLISSAACLAALCLATKDTTYSVITFEHDAWDLSAMGHGVRKASRVLLRQLGYHLLISDVAVPPEHDGANGGGSGPTYFEDWWVHPLYIDRGMIATYEDLSDGTQEGKYHWRLLGR